VQTHVYQGTRSTGQLSPTSNPAHEVPAGPWTGEKQLEPPLLELQATASQHAARARTAPTIVRFASTLTSPAASCPERGLRINRDPDA
jgi:hypothetical protein